MVLNIFLVIYSLFSPFITMFKSLVCVDSPGFCSTSIASSSHGVAILHSGKFHIFFSFACYLSLKSKIGHHHRVQRVKLRLEMLFFSNKCVNFIKNYENSRHLMRQNGVTSCFFSNFNCFPLITDISNPKSNTTIVFSGTKYPRITGFLTKLGHFYKKIINWPLVAEIGKRSNGCFPWGGMIKMIDNFSQI